MEARDGHIAYLGLGSNTGDRGRHLASAVEGLGRHPRVSVQRVSPVYETEAHTLGDEAQPDYLNAVVEVCTSLTPEALLALGLALERGAGRRREGAARWAPRTLDVDLLVYDGYAGEAPDLTLPHPRMGVRRFVLQPLADLNPGLYIPAPFDATVADLLARCPDPTVPRRRDGAPSEL